MSEVHSGNWTGVNLSGANLALSRLHDMDLTGANLMGAHMAGIEWYFVNLTDANMTGAEFSAVWGFTSVIWSNTTCPDGTNSDNDGGTCINNLAI